MESAQCGECHKDIYEHWKGSMHHFASFNNQFYRAPILHMQKLSGTKGSKWCTGYHDHAVFFNGRFERPIKAARGYAGSAKWARLRVVPFDHACVQLDG